jgi:hypothetical protein
MRSRLKSILRVGISIFIVPDLANMFDPFFPIAEMLLTNVMRGMQTSARSLVSSLAGHHSINEFQVFVFFSRPVILIYETGRLFCLQTSPFWILN